MVQIGMVFIGNKIQQKEQIHSRPLLIQHHLLQLKLLNGYLLYQVIENFEPEKSGRLKNQNFQKTCTFEDTIIWKSCFFDTFGESIISGSR